MLAWQFVADQTVPEERKDPERMAPETTERLFPLELPLMYVAPQRSLIRDRQHHRGGVTAEVFRESLELVAEAGAPFAGVLCGRANWQGGVPVYAQGGSDALSAWLEEDGVTNITALNGLLAAGARPWWTVSGCNLV